MHSNLILEKLRENICYWNSRQVAIGKIYYKKYSENLLLGFLEDIFHVPRFCGALIRPAKNTRYEHPLRRARGLQIRPADKAR